LQVKKANLVLATFYAFCAAAAIYFKSAESSLKYGRKRRTAHLLINTAIHRSELRWARLALTDRRFSSKTLRAGWM
jgi:hypothetical protein